MSRLPYLLAALNLLTLALSAWLSAQIIGAYGDSHTIHQRWRERREDYQRLVELAMAANAPGNDIFTTGLPDCEDARLHEAAQAFQRERARIREQLLLDVDREHARAIEAVLQDMDGPIVKMISSGEQVLYWFRKQDLPRAAKKMAQMDQALARFVRARAELIRSTGAIERDVIRRSEDRIATLKAWWLAMTALLSLLVGGTLWYGRRVAARSHFLEHAREKSEARYRTLFESSRDAIMNLSPPDWKFTSGNPATAAMFGTRDETEFVSLGPGNCPLNGSRTAG